MRKTKIVCTLGPATEKGDVLRQLFLNGMNVARINFSHGTQEEHGRTVDAFKALRGELGLPVGLLIDTKGPEIRIRDFAQGQIELTEGDTFTWDGVVREVPGWNGDQTLDSASGCPACGVIRRSPAGSGP